MNPFDGRFRGPLCEAAAWLWIVHHAPVLTSYRKLATAWGWTLPQVQRFMDRLSSDTLIDTRKSKAGTEISLCNAMASVAAENVVTLSSDTPSDTPQIELFDAPDRMNDGLYRFSAPTALPPSWYLPQTWGEWAMEERGITANEVRAEADRFKGYWLDKARTARGKKKQWALAWRNWIRSPYRKGADQRAAETSGFMDEFDRKYQNRG